MANDRGFTTLEAVLAFTVLSVGLASLLGAVGGGAAAARRGLDAAALESAARSALAALDAAGTLRAGELTPEGAPPGVRIVAEVVAPRAGAAPALYRVTVSATGGPDAPPRRFVTVRAGGE
jgi:hypothetical protein